MHTSRVCQRPTPHSLRRLKTLLTLLVIYLLPQTFNKLSLGLTGQGSFRNDSPSPRWAAFLILKFSLLQDLCLRHWLTAHQAHRQLSLVTKLQTPGESLKIEVTLFAREIYIRKRTYTGKRAVAWDNTDIYWETRLHGKANILYQIIPLFIFLWFAFLPSEAPDPYPFP